MPTLKVAELVRACEGLGTKQVNDWLKESIDKRELSIGDFPDLGRVFEECFGWQEFRACRFDNDRSLDQVYEGAGAVTTASFKTITQNIVSAMSMEGYTQEEFVFTNLTPSEFTPYNGERIPGITEMGDEAQVVPENEPYPLVGFSERWTDTPILQKRGKIVPVTREALFFDRTGQVAVRARNVRYWLAVNTEKRAIDCWIDENGGAKNALLGGHRWNYMGASIATYGNNSGTHDWDNLVATNALVDETDLDNAEQAADGLTDPDTGEPIEVMFTHLVHTRGLTNTVHHIINGGLITRTNPGFATTGVPTSSAASNRWFQKYTPVTSSRLASRLATDTDWFLVNPSRAFVRLYNWLPEVREAPNNNHDEFHRDIALQVRISQRDAFYVKNPRYAQKSTVA